MAWEIDPFHSLVEFSVSHLMISTVKGRFNHLRGTIHLDPKYPENSWVKAQIKSESIFTGVSQRDAHLRSADFFDVSRYPTINFESTRVNVVDSHRCLLDGNLSLCGETRPATFQVIYIGQAQDPTTNAWRVGLAALTSIDRREFGMVFNPEAMGAVVIGYKIRIEANVEAVLM
jgi:polyisoprenoid-binding protein YceI